ncbi:MAG TPA: hypothetical protein VKA50_10185 [Gammaproteobacteria bacterium]|nr:hypothetical protein [Gammaproteobacteria bacterium]
MITAERIAEGLGAKRYGASWRCPCPVCGEKNESKFKISEGDRGPLVYCFAGCDFRTLVAELKQRGLWDDWGRQKPKGPPPRKVEWARWVIAIFEGNQRDGRYAGNGQYEPWQPSHADRQEYRKARAVLKEAREGGTA